MRVWLACFFILFALAELFDWIKHISLPMPIYILGGAFLAIASNYSKHFGFLFDNSSAETPSVIDSEYSPKWDTLCNSHSNLAPQPSSQSLPAAYQRAGENLLDETK